MNEKKQIVVSLFRYLRFVVFFLFLFLLESSLLPSFSLYGEVPDLLFPAVVAVTLCCGAEKGVLFALFAALLGMSEGGRLAFCLPLLFSAGAVCVSFFSDRFDRKGKWAFLLLTGVIVSFLSAGFDWIGLWIGRGTLSLSLPAFPAKLFLNLIVFFPVFFAVLLLKGNNLRKKTEKERGK